MWSLPKIKKFFPLVVLQILFGIVLGPSFLGNIAPNLQAELFTPEILTRMSNFSQIGLIFLGFIIGLHIDLGNLEDAKISKLIYIGLCSVLVPFCLSLPVGLVLFSSFPRLAGINANALTFALTISVSASVTALPVLGAILIETKLLKDKIGKLAIIFATVNDITLWVLLTIIVAISSSVQANNLMIIKNIVLLVMFAVITIKVLRPLLGKTLKIDTIDQTRLAFIVGGVLLFANFAEMLQIHAILGAFLLGLSIPQKLAQRMLELTENLVFVLLLPFFLTLTGLKTNVSAQASEIWIIFFVITLSSMVGNFFGISIPAYFSGFNKKDSVTLGILMQCKGLMEIVILTIFLNANVLSPLAFSGMTLMAIFTTAATKPLLYMWLGRRKDPF